MNRTLTLLLFALHFAPTLFAAQGGPDAYGYIWKDSNEPDGPVYEWIDILTTGALIQGLGDDNVVGPYSMATDMPFYWYGRKNIWIGSNGYIAFNPGNIASPFPTIPTAGGLNDYIAAMTADLTFAGVGNLGRCYWHDTDDRTIVSYISVPFWSATAPNYTGSNTFQVILDKTDSTITVQYQQQTGLTNNTDLLVGIESVAGSIGLQHSADIYPPTNFAVRFYLPPQTSLLINDAAVGWNTQVGNGGKFLSRNGTALPLVTNVRNTGNTDLTNVQVNAEVRNAANMPVASGSATVNMIFAGLDQTVSLNGSFVPTTNGTYRFTTAVDPVPDEVVPINNTLVQELVVVDTTQLTHELKFTGATDDGIGLSWDGGNGGVAVHFIPPYYPAYASATTVRITSNIGNSAFSMKVYRDDGPFGTAGTLLDSVYVPSAEATAGDHVIPLNEQLTISSGGVYVLWYMNGPNVNIAQDIVAPFSLRTYEVLGNTWAEYRDRENVDFHIGLQLAQAPILDVGCTGFFGITNGQNINAPVNVRTWITNYGNQPAVGFPVTYQFSNYTPITETYNATPIQPGQQVLFAFTQPFVPGENTTSDICAWSAWDLDSTTDNDTICVSMNTFVGIGELASISVRSWPNPTAERLTVEGIPPGDVVVTIVDAVGRSVQRTKATAAGGPLQMNVGALAPGSYRLHMESSSGQYRTTFIVQR